MRRRSGFSLIELLTVISTMVLLIGIGVPALSRARIYTRSLISARNQRDIVTAVTLFACEHDQQFPSSVALCERPDRRSWRWQDPRKLRTTEPLQRMKHSSVAAYLKHYLEDSTRLTCPSIPQPYPLWPEAWEAGDNWDHPDTEKKQDAVFGSYCLYWNYVGYQDNGPFRGPQTLYGGPGESEVLVSDYFGYDEARSPGLYGSCELTNGAQVKEAKSDILASAFWSYDITPPTRLEDIDIRIRLNAGYTDGHVESYFPNESQLMKVSDVPNGSRPYFKGIDPRYPGLFFIPQINPSR